MTKETTTLRHSRVLDRYFVPKNRATYTQPPTAAAKQRKGCLDEAALSLFLTFQTNQYFTLITLAARTSSSRLTEV